MSPRTAARMALPALLAGVAGCISVAGVTNVREPACVDELERQIDSILEAEGEPAARAAGLARETVDARSFRDIGPRPFLVSSPSGVDYSFFVQKKKPSCVLRLYARQKGFVSYSNDLTFIATRALPSCACAE